MRSSRDAKGISSVPDLRSSFLNGSSSSCGRTEDWALDGEINGEGGSSENDVTEDVRLGVGEEGRDGEDSIVEDSGDSAGEMVILISGLVGDSSFSFESSLPLGGILLPSVLLMGIRVLG